MTLNAQYLLYFSRQYNIVPTQMQSIFNEQKIFFIEDLTKKGFRFHGEILAAPLSRIIPQRS